MKKLITFILTALFLVCLFFASYTICSSILNKKSNNSEEIIDYQSYGQESSASLSGSIELEKSIYYINIGETTTIKVISTNSDVLKWSSENPDISSVDESGSIKGLKEGRTKVLAKLSDDDYASVEVVVIDPEKTTKEEVQKQDAMEDESFVVKPTDPVTPSEPSNSSTPDTPSTPSEPTPSTPSTPVTPSEPTPSTPIEEDEPKEDPVQEDEPVVEPTPVSPIIDEDDPVVPVPPEEEGPIVVSSVVINKTSLTGYTRDTDKITATVYPKDASNNTVVWSSSDTSVVTVSQNGLVKYKKSGNATITATAGKRSATISVLVKSRERIHFISHQESNGKDHITGDAILLESNGSFAMIDMGNIDKSSEIVNYLINNDVTALDFVLFTHMDSDHAGNLQAILSAGIKVKNIWMKNYDVASYRENYVANMKNGIDIGLGEQNSKASTYRLNKALARYKRIRYLSENSSLKDLVTNINIISNDTEGKEYTFKNLKFTMRLYNNERNVNAINSENYNSVSSLISVNGYKVLLTGDDEDTKKFNQTASSIGKIDVLKVAHHGSQCSLMPRKYSGDKINSKGTRVNSTALNSLKPNYYVITSSRKKIQVIKKEQGVSVKCVDKVLDYNKNADIRYVDETSNALILDLTGNSINFITK